MKILVIGSGLVGAAMADDLAYKNEFDVTVSDINSAQFSRIKSPQVKKVNNDVTNHQQLTELVKGFDLILSAVPGHLGYKTLETIINAGKNAVDIAFFPEDPFLLQDAALKNNVSILTDCGVAPGMMHILTGYVNAILDKTITSLTYVGGLPVIREYPFQYKAVFSPIDVVEEYTRPARYIENGKEVVKEALSDTELINFPGIGTLEAFNSDGIRSLATTIKADNIKEKTLRYPGHVELMKVFRHTGFFSKEDIKVGDVSVKPMDITAKLLFPKWELKPGESDLTVMKVIVEGIKEGKNVRYIYDLLDYYDTNTQTHSMARTTGYTATAAIRMLANGLFTKKGIIVPEYIGKHADCVKFILKELAQRGIIYKETIEIID